MAEVYWLWVAVLVTLPGMAWLALSLDVHWRQVVGPAATTGVSSPAASLRLFGAACIAASLLFCLMADHASMAVLVWIMLAALSAAVVAATLTWRPSWLKLLALPWLPTTVSTTDTGR